MGKAMLIAKEERARIGKKWADFFESGQSLTPEKREEMEKDDKAVAELCKKATLEWLEENSTTETKP